MAGYYSKRQKKYIGFHSYFYCGIGFILGTLIHSLFTWRFGVTHFIFFFIAMFEIVCLDSNASVPVISPTESQENGRQKKDTRF